MSERKRVAIGDQVYCENKTRYLLRLIVQGRPTWRRLNALTSREARREAAILLAAKSRASAGLGNDPFLEGQTIGAIAKEYLDKGCPDGRWGPRHERYQKQQAYLLRRPIEFLGAVSAVKLRLPLIENYAEWARKKMRFGKGNRTLDMEMVALSNVYRWAMSMGMVDENPLLKGRRRFQHDSEVKHCRETAPESAEELHRIARAFFQDPRSEVLGWQLLLEALTGCRTSEILRLRMDAIRIQEPGFVDEKYLFIQRSKRGLQPHVPVHDDLAELIRAHHHWHACRYPKSPWWLPGRDRDGGLPINCGALSHALRRICPRLGLPHRTSHGLRSYYVTTRRSQLVSDWEIAAEIGDRTVDLIHRTYGDRPANYRGGSQHGWRPVDGAPAWVMALPENSDILCLPKAENAPTVATSRASAK